MLRAQDIGMSLATVTCECSLNHLIFYFTVRKFVCVHRETQQIFMDVNTEYRANLVKTRVNDPITLLHIYWVCQYKLFLLSEGWEEFTEPSKPSLECLWSDNQFPTAIPYLVVLYQIVTSVSSISLKLLVQKLPFSYELYLK